MSKTLVIWIIGGSGVGKSTLARNLHEWIRKTLYSGKQNGPILVRFPKSTPEIFYTKYSDYSCNLGDMTKSQCGGCDTLSNKEQIISTFNQAIQDFPIVVLEGIMATGQWGDFLKTRDTILFLVHLGMSSENNFKRLKERRSIKKGVDVSKIVLEQKTMDNLSRKLRGFKSLYNKMKSLSDFSIDMEVDNKDEKTVARLVIGKLEKIFLEI